MLKTKSFLLAAGIVLAMAFTFSCTSDIESAEEVLARANSSSDGNSSSAVQGVSSGGSSQSVSVFCDFGNGSCQLFSAEACLVFGQVVEFCPGTAVSSSSSAPPSSSSPVPSSSSSLPSAAVFCEYSGICSPISSDFCALLGGTPVQSCPESSSSSSIALSSSYVAAISSSSVAPSSSSVVPSSSSVPPSSSSITLSSSSSVYDGTSKVALGCCKWDTQSVCYTIYDSQKEVADCQSGDNKFWTGKCPSEGGSCPSIVPSSSSAAPSSQSSEGSCAGFTNGTKRLHYGKDKEQFCDERNGKKYVYVKIGEQTWMAENLNYNATNSKCYGNNENNCVTYGRMYNWDTAMNNASSSIAVPSGVQGVCPTGWHLPSPNEWGEMTTYIGGSNTEGKKLKATNGWNSNGNGTDDYGFSALPGGVGYSGGDFYSIGSEGGWWSTKDNSDGNDNGGGNGYYRSMDHYNEASWWGCGKSGCFFSVRCVKD